MQAYIERYFKNALYRGSCHVTAIHTYPTGYIINSCHMNIFLQRNCLSVYKNNCLDIFVCIHSFVNLLTIELLAPPFFALFFFASLYIFLSRDEFDVLLRSDNVVVYHGILLQID